MNFLTRISSVLLLGGLLVGSSARATPITGSVSISGSVTLNNASLSLATGAVSGKGFVTSATGDFSGTLYSLVQYYPFYWNPSTVPVDPLWSFTYSGKSYSFALNTLSVQTQTNLDLVLSGSGMLHIDGFTDTPGAWRYSVNNSSGTPQTSFKFGFTSSDNSVRVPDTAATAVLLAIGLATIGFAAGARRLTQS